MVYPQDATKAEPTSKDQRNVMGTSYETLTATGMPAERAHFLGALEAKCAALIGRSSRPIGKFSAAMVVRPGRTSYFGAQLDGLPPHLRQAFHLRYIDGLSDGESARALGTTVQCDEDLASSRPNRAPCEFARPVVYQEPETELFRLDRKIRASPRTGESFPGWLAPTGMGVFAKLFGPAEPKVWPVHVDDDNFVAEVRRSDLPVLLDVWGPSCAPCKQMEPIIFRLAKKYQGRVKVAEINAAAAPRTMKKLFVNSTPTVIYFNKGQEVERVVGLRGEHYHQEFIDDELLDGEPAVAAPAQKSQMG